jgi:hypothetical protein
MKLRITKRYRESFNKTHWLHKSIHKIDYHNIVKHLDCNKIILIKK